MSPIDPPNHQLSQSISRKMSGPLQQTMDALSTARSVAVVCHIHPDADAVGSASAMVMALRQRGVRAVATYGIDELPAKSMLTIPGWNQFVAYTDLPDDIDTWVVVDCGTSQRLGELEDRILGADRVINIDHHNSNELYGTVNCVDIDAESTSMVLVDLFEVWNIKLNRDMAHALYAGLLTDTDSFQFGRARMHTAAAKLLNMGLDPRVISAQLLECHPFEYLPFLSRVMATAERVPEWGGGAGLVHVTVAHDDMGDIGHDEVKAVIDVVRITAGSDVTVALKEYEPGEWTLSLRSREKVDVSVVAEYLGGGGHTRAAGCRLYGTRDEVLDQINAASATAAAAVV
ncbi:bifunctional oligoribonuclease/PAP phosphatase NrnA [Corynebacterium sp. TAE3-ERU12]|uniref:DHH family phosphoesterase n=1 Tax=Corynebacterium sp. TAE3-ERU12 TaxID=2849491 RepID=UPI001C46BB1B|nr:bifunctional oligoribonuclease/PAP phosphatase NrnA [Corynebacterium sp. TAE3-ERU12]MBV7295248.1 bifunctional oligoribonuclease/PAP phosphatase NrnA [Corynebacterium sp. TAE3-ERU12]